jgi:hypothetical protein
MTSIKKDKLSFFARSSEKTRKIVALETKMLVIRKMEAGEIRANVRSSLDFVPTTVSPIMTHAEKIKQSAQKTTKLRASYISYTRNFNVGKLNSY